MARWDAKWHTLSPQARLAYLKDVKGPQQAQGPNQKRPSVKADRFAASVLEELLAAGFVELGDSGSAGPRDRVFAVVAASDFATRVRAATVITCCGATFPACSRIMFVTAFIRLRRRTH